LSQTFGERAEGGKQLHQEYCCWAAKRLAIAERDPTIQGYADGVFWERNSLSAQKLPTAPAVKADQSGGLFHE
jgi:hypothetical protein